MLYKPWRKCMVHSSALQVFRRTFAFFFTCRLGIRAAVGRRHVAFLGHVTCILIGPFSRCLGFGCDTLIVYFILFQYYINGDVYGCILELNVDKNSIRKNVQPSAEGTWSASCFDFWSIKWCILEIVPNTRERDERKKSLVPRTNNYALPENLQETAKMDWTVFGLAVLCVCMCTVYASRAGLWGCACGGVRAQCMPGLRSVSYYEYSPGSGLLKPPNLLSTTFHDS